MLYTVRMKTYLVGGAVRNQLLGLPVHERDWVVVGATGNALLDAGYQQVGKDFPVFLHPQTREEYALARTERKTGTGYTGFECISDSSITLEQDLLRRDLTVNAIAQDEDGALIDPYHGLADIEQRLLRHVSDAFREDPLRVLRVARFAATFYPLGFRIADETRQLMQQMSASGELSQLTPERVWKETDKALNSSAPQVYFQVLRDCGALAVLFPEVDALFGVPQTEKHHPEIDTGIHTLMVLEQAAQLSVQAAVRFAALTHDLGKALTPVQEWPRHIQHEQRGLQPLRALCQRLKVPKEWQQLALLVCEYHLLCHRAFELRPETVYKLFSALDVWRRPERLPQFLTACEADARGRSGFEHSEYPQAAYFRQLFAAANAVSIRDIDRTGLSGTQIGQAINNARIQAIQQAKQQYQHRQAHE